MKPVKTIVFDLGGVLVDWNPEYLYKKMFSDPEKMRYFLQNICTPDWNEEQDAGRPLKEGTALLIEQHPELETEIKAYYGRWEEMLGTPFPGTVEILKQLKDSKKYPIYALTNWSAETFPVALEKFDFMHWFDGVVVSGTEKTRKPFADFYRILTTRYRLAPDETLFIDDNLRNIQSAAEIGFQTIHFTSPAALKSMLKELKVL